MHNTSRLVTAVIFAVIILLVILTWVAFGEARTRGQCHAEGITNAYDDILKVAARRYMEEPLRSRWCLTKAICWVESQCDPNAASGAGAEGLLQVTKPTAETARRLIRAKRQPLPRSHDLRNAKTNAAYAAATLQRMWNVWISPRSAECRWELAAASYNAGPGHIIEAQKLAAGALCWEKIRASLPDVTGRHARETIDYVGRVWRTYYRLRGFEF